MISSACRYSSDLTWASSSSYSSSFPLNSCWLTHAVKQIQATIARKAHIRCWWNDDFWNYVLRIIKGLWSSQGKQMKEQNHWIKFWFGSFCYPKFHSYAVFPLHGTCSTHLDSPFLVFHYEKSPWYLLTDTFFSTTSVKVPSELRWYQKVTWKPADYWLVGENRH